MVRFPKLMTFEQLCWVIMALAMVYFLVLFTLTYQEGSPNHIEQFSLKERSKIREMHRNHGVESSIIDTKTGEWYFIREGKRCRI